MTTNTTTSKECWSANDEDFNYESLEDLLDSHDDLKPGDVVYLAEAHHPELRSMIDADWLIEQIGECAHYIGGEYAEGYPECTKEQKEKLQALLEQWLSECPAPRFYQVKNARPYTLTEDDL